MNGIEWMMRQPAPQPQPLRAPEPKRLRRGSIVIRSDGSEVTNLTAKAELGSAVEATLRQFGPLTAADIRPLLDRGLFVAFDGKSQAAEISAALKVLRTAGAVTRNDVEPYVWAASSKEQLP